MASNLLRFTLVQSFWGQELLNVFYYQSDGVPVNSESQEWLSLFNGLIPGEIRDVTSSAYTQEKTILDYPNTGFQDEQSLGNINGSLSGDAAAPFMAFGFRLQRTNNTTRHGFKRIGGLQEAYPTSDLITGAGSNTALDEIAVAMFQTLVQVIGTQEAIPVIIGKNNSNAPGSWTANPVAGVQFQRITTQNTRKIGRGS
jgi:hypothetical protein